jgi:hypothetical protein
MHIRQINFCETYGTNLNIIMLKYLILLKGTQN